MSLYESENAKAQRSKAATARDTNGPLSGSLVTGPSTENTTVRLEEVPNNLPNVGPPLQQSRKCLKLAENLERSREEMLPVDELLVEQVQDLLRRKFGSPEEFLALELA